jgi:hypothetical protein
MKIEIKKLWKDSVDVRNYVVQSCIDKNENLEITHGVDKMILTPKELKHDLTGVSKLFQSKTGGRDYRLVSYMWNPIKTEL